VPVASLRVRAPSGEKNAEANVYGPTPAVPENGGEVAVFIVRSLAPPEHDSCGKSRRRAWQVRLLGELCCGGAPKKRGKHLEPRFECVGPGGGEEHERTTPMEVLSPGSSRRLGLLERVYGPDRTGPDCFSTRRTRKPYAMMAYSWSRHRALTRGVFSRFCISWGVGAPLPG